MACNSINSTLEVFTLIMLGCLLAALLHERNGIRRDAMFLAVIFCHAVSTAGDLLAWRFAGKAGALAGTLSRLGNILTYLFIPLASTGFLTLLFFYVLRRRRLKTAPGRLLAAMIIAVAAAAILILASNPWTGLLYRIDETNTFYWGKASTILSDGVVLIHNILFSVLLVIEVRGEPHKRLWRALVLCAIPAAAVLVELTGLRLMLIYPAAATSLLLLYFGRQEELEEQTLRQKLELENSRTKLLLAQIQPHFIFNSLLAIQQLCEEDPQKAERAVGDFSEYLRGNLDAMTNDTLIPFSQELEHIRCYLALETVDPASRIKAEYRLEAADFYLPPLTVQPLVENAVRHGLKTRAGGGTVTVGTRETADGWLVTVADDGVGFSSITPQQENRRSVGLENVRARLAAQCGGTLHIESGGHGTTATVFIPKKKVPRPTEDRPQ